MATTQFNFRAFIEGIDSLYEIAKRLGYVQSRGGRGRGGLGEGSPKQLMEAIAAGKALVIRNPYETDHEIQQAVQRLRAMDGPDAAIITSLADALEQSR